MKSNLPDFRSFLDKETLNEIFTIPEPTIIDKNKNKSGGKYLIGENYISIIPDNLEKLNFPIVIDPVTIDSSATATGTAYGNGRKLFRDAYGNLIALMDGGTGNDNAWYKAFNATSWTDANIDLDASGDNALGIAADLDSSGNIHVAFTEVSVGNLHYKKITVTRTSNAISSMALGSNINLDQSSLALRPTLIIANKGGGSGVEKVAIAYAVNTTGGGTTRGEIRFLQCDVADDCLTAGNWKNASEEINGSGTCSNSVTSGAAGLPDTTVNAGCKGTTDKLLQQITSHTKHHVVLTQMPGRPKRNAGSVKKDLNGTFSDLNNLEDGNSGTTDNINSLTTTDYLYIGDLQPFSKVSIDIDTTNSNAATFSTKEYCSVNSDVDTTCDTWTSVSSFIDNTTAGGKTLLDSGDSGLKGSLFFDEPSDWVQSTENGTKEYWVRIRPSGALDSTVSLADIYLTDRNSKALLIVGGVDSCDCLGTGYVVWDDIGNTGWENTAANAGVPWRENSISIDTDGGDWTTFTNFPLTSTVDYINNRVYIAYVSGTAVGSSDIAVKYIQNNKDPTAAANWINSGFPSVTEAAGIVLSLTSDESDIYLFYVLNPTTNGLVYRKCSPGGGGNGNYCDNASDWGSEVTLDSATDRTHPQAVLSKMPGDNTTAIDLIYTQDTTTDTVQYERHFVDNQDKSIAISTDDHARSYTCSTTQTQSVSTQVSVAFTLEDCGVGLDGFYHGGVRFQSVTVSQGATISSAYIDISLINTSGTVVGTVYGEDANDSASYTDLGVCDSTCVHNRTRTTSSVSINSTYSTNRYRIDVTKIVQEIVCRGASNAQPCVGNFNGAGSWASGNDLSILFIPTNSGSSHHFGFASNTIVGPLPKLNINLANETTGKSYSKGVRYPHQGASSFSNLDHPLSNVEFSSVGTDDSNYASVSAELNPTASVSAVPMFMFKHNNSNNNNTYKIDASAVVRSSIPTSSKTMHLQIYRGGSTNDWIDVDTDTTTVADTDIALDISEITTSTSEYYFNETPGIGTQYAECTNSTANCWTYWRIWQEPLGQSGANQILYADYFNVTYAANGPDKVAFSNSARTLTVNACNGAASVFTMELQSGTTPTNPQATTVVRVTSNSSDYTIYSDDTCSTVVTNGDFTYTTSQNTKSVYIVDNKKSVTTRTLSGIRQSGDTLTTGTQNYTVNAGTTATRLVVTMPGQTFSDSSGNSGSTTSRTAGSSFNIVQISATDDYSNIITGDTRFDNDIRTIDYAGPANAPDTTPPSYTTSVQFTNGVATTTLATTLYKAETTTITVTDGGSLGYASSSFTVDHGSITAAAASTVTGAATGNLNEDVTITMTFKDEWDNLHTSILGANISFTGTTGNYAVTAGPTNANGSGVSTADLRWASAGTKTVYVTVTGEGQLTDTHSVVISAPTPRTKIQGGTTIRGGTSF